jgi:hypothetical protein
MNETALQKSNSAPVAVMLALLFATLSVAAVSIHFFLQDEALWNYIGWAWVRHGVPPYTGAFENKTPGIFFVYALSNISGGGWLFARMLGAAALTCGGYLVWRLASVLESEAAGLWSLAFYALLILTDRTEFICIGYTESFMIFFTAAAFFVYAGAEADGAGLRLLSAGLLAGTAILFKQVAALSGFALLLWITCRTASGHKARRAALFLTGILAANAAAAALLMCCGTKFGDYMDGTFLSLLGLLHNAGSGARSSWHLWFGQGLRLWGLWLVFAVPVALFALSIPRRRENGIFILLWLAADFAGVNLSGDYYRHQFRQLVPALALICGMVIARAEDLRIKLTGRQHALAAMFLVVWACALTVRKLEAHGGADNAPGAEFAGLMAADMTAPGDYVYICESRSSQAQNYSGRLSPSRYFNTLFVFGSRERSRLLADLSARPPALVLVHGEAPTWLSGYLAINNYEPAFEKYDYDFYRKR